MNSTQRTDNSIQAAILPVQKYSLRKNLPLIIAVALLVPFVVVSVSTYTFIYRTEQVSWQDRQAETTSYASESVTHFISDTFIPLRTLGLLDRAYLVQNPSFASGLVDEDDALLELLRVDSSGQVFASAYRDVAMLPQQIASGQAAWFTRARVGARYLSELQLSADSSLYLVVSIPAPDGGVVAARLRMDVLWSVVDNIRFGQTGIAYIINTQGDVLAHTDREIVTRRENVLGQSDLDQVLDQPEKLWSGIYTNLNGERVLAATTAVQGTDWIIATEVQEAEAFSVSRSALLVLSVGMFLVYLLIVSVTSRQLRRYIFNPLSNLAEGAERVGRGDLDQSIVISRRDEIGTVTDAFNQMTVNLRDRNQQLAEEAKQRDSLIGELQVATEAAAESSRLKSEFLSTMSHELRTPLNAIIGFSGILLEGMAGQLDPITRPMVESIYTSSRHLLELINNILDVSKIEAGRVQFVYAPTSLYSMVDEWTDQIEVLAAKKSLKLTTTIEPHVPNIVKLDKARVTQIALNLLGNAVKFTDAGSIAVRINWIEGNLVLTVKDTGIGIPPHALDFIFDEFRQVNSTSSRKFEGTGLGLAVVRKLCSAMNGSVQVKSTINEGSEFTVILPAPIIGTAELVS